MIDLPIVTVDGIEVPNVISAYMNGVWYWPDENTPPHPKTDCVERMEIEGLWGQPSKTKYRARIRGGDVRIEWRGLLLESYTA